MENEVGLCPLLTCIGNCYYGADCSFKHPAGTIEKTLTELKPKKALKLGGGDWKPKEASKTDSTASKPVGKEQEQAGNKLGKQQLNASAYEFVPGRGNVQQAFEQNFNVGGQQYIYGGAQIEENKGADDDDFDPQDFFEQEDYYEEEGGDDGVLDTPDYFHVNSKGCSCCQGYINACMGPLCQSLGYCHCYAAEIEEEAYRQKRA